MVGIPGSSQACNTCRKRKKGCDLKRPSCGQCLKRNIPCGGYQREAKFINLSSQHNNSVTRSRRNVAGTTNIADSASAEDIHHLLAFNQAFNSGMYHSMVSCQNTAVLESCISYFFNSSIPESVEFKQAISNVNESSFADWIAIAPQLDITDQTLRTTLLALGLSRVGRSTGDVRLVRESWQFYSSALSSLRISIHRSAEHVKDETIAGIMFLSLYEILEGSPMRGFGWASHVEAATRCLTIQNFSSQTNWSYVRRKLFLGLRLFAVIRAIGKRKQASFETPEWVYSPCLQAKTTHRHRLLDLMALIPSVSEDIDSINYEAVANGDLEMLIRVSNRCCDVARQLDLWHEIFQADNDNKVYWEEPSTINCPPAAIENLRPTYLCFSDIDNAQSELLYWASTMVLQYNLWFAYRRLARQNERQFTFNQNPSGLLYWNNTRGDENREKTKPFFMPLPSTAMVINTFARNIGRSLEYFVEPKSISMTIVGIAFPAAMAFWHLKYNQSPECTWFKAILDHIKQVSGIDLEQFLAAVLSEKASEAIRK